MNIGFHHLLINQNNKAHSPPLGVLTLMQLLRNRGFACTFNQFTHVRNQVLEPTLLARQILSTPGVAAISTMINGLPLLIMALRIVKKEDPDKLIIVGGPGFTGIAKNAIRNFPELDIVCFGEGEIQVLALANWLAGNKAIHEVPGICYREKGEMKITVQVDRIQHLDEIPYMCLEAFHVNDYTGYPVMASRGCPFKCAFCDVAPSWGRRNTRRSVDHVLDELDFLYDNLGLRKISFVDDLFIVNRKWVEEFCTKKLDRGNNIKWRANGHINLATEPLLQLMANAGCESIFYGVESGSTTILKTIQKDFSFEKATEVLQFSSKYMNVNLNLIWGYPFETTEELQATLRAHRFFDNKGIGSSLVMLAPLQSAPLTDIHKELVLDYSYPNIFLQDYYDLNAKFGHEFEDLLASDSKVFSAFYAFSHPLLNKHVQIVRDYKANYYSQKQFASPRELWEGV